MKKQSYFWSHFEEQTIFDENQESTLFKTQTRQREEPDQRFSGMSSSTRTMTATREEPDQDSNQSGYSSIPRFSSLHCLKTLTETREEPDQDASCEKYGTFLPKNKKT